MRSIVPLRCALLGAYMMCAPLASSWAVAPQDVDAVDAAEDPLAMARAALLDGIAAELELSLHATTLLDAGDTEFLRPLLQPGANEVVARAVLAALNNARYIGFRDELLSMSGGATDDLLRRAAAESLRRMACADAETRDALVADLRAGERPLTERRTIVAVLGSCRDLASVTPLLEQLGGELSEETHDALVVLTGFDPHPRGDAEAWSRLWARHQHRSREELVEIALERARNQIKQLQLEGRQRELEHDERLAAMINEVEQLRILLMGSTEVSRLIDGLLDPYPRVRQTAAIRLAEHPSHELATAAVPALLARLGTGGTPGSNGEGLDVERDPAVRAAVVGAVGELGRNLPEVLPVLIHELGSPHGEVSGAAVSALAKVRGNPSVVGPLLDLLDRSPGDAHTLKLGLSIIAANRPPAGTVGALETHLAAAPTPAVQAEAVRALLACQELDTALDLVAHLAEPGAPIDVHFALARALGDRSREADVSSAQQARVVALLGTLAANPDPSVRGRAVSSLGESGAPEALVALEARAPSETDPAVLLKVVEALGELGNADGIDTLGRLVAERDGDEPLRAQANLALLSLGARMGSSEWWSVAQTLREVRAFELALVAAQQVVSPGQPTAVADRQFVPQARGMQAELLAQVERWREAYDLLLVLHEAGAAYPPAEERLALLAECAEQLELFAAAADHHGELRALLPEGDARHELVARRLADALWSAGLNERAAVEIQGLYDAKPEDNDLMCWLGEVRMALGEDDLARDLFERLADRVSDEDAELRARVTASLELLGPAPDPALTEDPDAPPVEPPGEGDEDGLDTDGGGEVGP